MIVSRKAFDVKRRVAILILFLFLGLAVTIATAWGLAYRGLVNPTYEVMENPSEILKIVNVDIDLDPIVERNGCLGFVEYEVLWHIPGESHAAWLFRFGWPAKSFMRIEKIRDGGSLWKVPGGSTSSNVSSASIHWRTPRQPIWSGLIINSIVFAFLLFLFAITPIKLRNLWRSRREQCTVCGYDLRGVEHECCPECGTKVTRSVSP